MELIFLIVEVSWRALLLVSAGPRDVMMGCELLLDAIDLMVLVLDVELTTGEVEVPLFEEYGILDEAVDKVLDVSRKIEELISVP